MTMKPFKLLALIVVALSSCQSVVQLHKDSQKNWINHRNQTFWFVAVNHEFIDTTATFNHKEAVKYYLTLKKRYNQKQKQHE